MVGKSWHAIANQKTRVRTRQMWSFGGKLASWQHSCSKRLEHDSCQLANFDENMAKTRVRTREMQLAIGCQLLPTIANF